MNDELVSVIFLGVLVLIGIPALFLMPKETCPHCGERRRLKKLASSQDQKSVESLFPTRFQTRQYQETWKCLACSETFTKVKFAGKNKNGSF